MAKRVPTPEGSVLHFYRNGKGKTELEVAERVGVTVQTIRNWESGRRPLPQVKLEEVLGAIDVPPAAVAEALLAHRLGARPEEPGSFAAPSGQVGRLIHQAAAAAGTAAAETVRTRLIEEWRQRLAQDHRRWAEEQWAKIQKLKPQKQELVLGVILDERNWALAERLCQASITAAAHKADEALRLARLAVRVAEQLPGPESRRLHMLGYCKDFEANALRVGGEMQLSEEAFVLADELWKQSIESDLRGLVDDNRRLDLKASLFMYRERTLEALSLIEAAMASTGVEQDHGRLLVKKARALEFGARYEDALGVLRHAEPLIESLQERRLLFALNFNRAVIFCHLDEYDEASRLLPQVRALTAERELDQIRLRWLEGRTWLGLGLRDEALSALSQARQYFRRNEIDYDFALVSLEIAVAHLEHCRIEIVQELTEEMLWIFQRQKVHKEALAALMLFCQATRREEVGAAWARGLVKYLYRAQHAPSLRFEP